MSVDFETVQPMSESQAGQALELRRQERVKMSCETFVTLQPSVGTLYGMTANVSEGGMYVAHEGNTKPTVGQVVYFVLNFCNTQVSPIEGMAIIRWSKERTLTESGGFGLEFQNMSGVDKERLKTALQAYEMRNVLKDYQAEKNRGIFTQS